MSIQNSKKKLNSRQQKKHSDKKIANVKSSSKIPKFKIIHKKKDVVKSTNVTKPISTNDQTITSSNGNSTEVGNKEQSSHSILPKKVSKLYFDAYSKLPKKQEVYENEENKQPKDLPTMKLLEAVHGISSHYANENNTELEGSLDTPALLCLGILVEEYTKHSTTDFMEKFDITSNQP